MAVLAPTRRPAESRLPPTRAARRRAAPNRDANWFELITGLVAFVTLAAASLYLVAWLGH